VNVRKSVSDGGGDENGKMNGDGDADHGNDDDEAFFSRVAKAVNTFDPKRIDAVLADAKRLGLEGDKEVKDARQLSKRIAKENAILTPAIESKNEHKLAAAVEKTKGSKSPLYAKAVKMLKRKRDDTESDSDPATCVGLRGGCRTCTFW